jgi:hypothetical protein
MTITKRVGKEGKRLASASRSAIQDILFWSREEIKLRAIVRLKYHLRIFNEISN